MVARMARRTISEAAFANFFLAVIFTGLPWIGISKYPGMVSAALLHSTLNTLIAFALGFAMFALQSVVTSWAARALGDRVVWLGIGVGPQLISRTLKSGTHIVVRLFPVVARPAHVTTRSAGQAMRAALALLAPAVVLGAALAIFVDVHPMTITGLIFAVHQRLAPDSLFALIATWIVFTMVVGALGLVLNFSGWSGVTPAVSQARRLLGHTFAVATLIDRGRYADGVALGRKGLEEKPDDVLLQAMVANALILQRDPEGFAIVNRLRSAQLPPALHAICANLWAWECYMQDDVARRDDAERAARMAVVHAPDNASYRDTLGHMLLWNGKLSEAESQLKRAFDRASAATTRTSAAIGLAMVFARTQRIDDATTWLARARAQAVEHPLLAQAIAIVEPARL